jgi:diphthine synthase
MTLYFIGLGLSDQKDISLKGLEAINKCSIIYLESYTSKLNCSLKELEDLYKKKIIQADREIVESNAEETILKNAKESDTAFLVIGDIFSATTHIDIWIRAKELGIKTVLIHNASIISGIGVTGLQVYKFGKTTSIPYPTVGWKPETAYDVIKENKGLHTLILLDLQPEKNKFMSVSEAIKILLDIESKRKEGIFTKDTFCVGCAGIGSEKQIIASGKAGKLQEKDFGNLIQCLVVPGQMHFMEEKALGFWELV